MRDYLIKWIIVTSLANLLNSIVNVERYSMLLINIPVLRNYFGIIYAIT